MKYLEKAGFSNVSGSFFIYRSTIHVAVVIDCWTNILGEITFENRPSKFDKFMQDVKKIYKDLTPCFGLEDTRGFGRNFTSYLLGHKFTEKHVNPAYTDSMRSSAPMSKKMICLMRFVLPRFCMIWWTLCRMKNITTYIRLFANL